jgi:hypothetical protein
VLTVRSARSPPHTTAGHRHTAHDHRFLVTAHTLTSAGRGVQPPVASSNPALARFLDGVAHLGGKAPCPVACHL